MSRLLHVTSLFLAALLFTYQGLHAVGLEYNLAGYGCLGSWAPEMYRSAPTINTDAKAIVSDLHADYNPATSLPVSADDLERPRLIHKTISLSQMMLTHDYPRLALIWRDLRKFAGWNELGQPPVKAKVQNFEFTLDYSNMNILKLTIGQPGAARAAGELFFTYLQILRADYEASRYSGGRNFFKITSHQATQRFTFDLLLIDSDLNFLSHLMHAWDGAPQEIVYRMAVAQVSLASMVQLQKEAALTGDFLRHRHVFDAQIKFLNDTYRDLTEGRVRDPDKELKKKFILRWMHALDLSLREAMRVAMVPQVYDAFYTSWQVNFRPYSTVRSPPPPIDPEPT